MEDELQNMEKTRRINKEKKKEISKKNEAVGEAYLAKAVQEKNLLYLSFYLHAYEGRINRRVYSFLRRNGMDTYNPALFLDLKFSLQEVILKKLPTFDPTKGAKFLTYMYEFIGDALTSFRMREECCYPFEIPAVLKSVYTNQENGVCIYTSQNAKIPQSILRQGEERLWGFWVSYSLER